MTTTMLQHCKNIILESFEDLDGADDRSPEEQISYAANRFLSEMGWRIQQVGKQKAAFDWVQGLALNVPYLNYDIIQLAKESGILRKNAREATEDRFIERYWKTLAYAFLRVCKL
jgi:hypothetical protein